MVISDSIVEQIDRKLVNLEVWIKELRESTYSPSKLGILIDMENDIERIGELLKNGSSSQAE